MVMRRIANPSYAGSIPVLPSNLERKSMLEAQEVRDILKENIVEVVFTKRDGSERRMFCTLIDEFLPSKGEEILTQTTEHNNKCITVWDLEADSWRSFRIDSIKSLEAEPVE